MAEVTGREARGLLLSALKLRRRDHPVRWSVGAAVLGVANLFFCAYMERFIDGTGDATGLLSFLAVESGVLLSAIAAVFLGEMDLLLRKTALLPYPGWVRFQFALTGMLRHPAILVLWATACFALAVIGPVEWIPLLAGTFFCILLGALLLTCFCTVLTVPTLVHSGGAPVIALAALFILGMVFWSATTSAEHLLAAVLPLRWTVDGIAAARAGHSGEAALNGLLLILPTAACLFWGTRHA